MDVGSCCLERRACIYLPFLEARREEWVIIVFAHPAQLPVTCVADSLKREHPDLVLTFSHLLSKISPQLPARCSSHELVQRCGSSVAMVKVHCPIPQLPHRRTGSSSVTHSSV